MHVSYQTDLNIVKGSLFLELVPLLLEDIECAFHLKFLQEVPNEVIDDNFSLESFGNLLLNSHSIAGLLHGFNPFLLSLVLQSCEVIQIVVIFYDGV
jgi:hypothetical protein